MKKAYNIIRLLRPKQWIKNLAVYATIVFAGQLFNQTAFLQATASFIVFCGLSSSIYIVNDIFDIDKDRLHPFKRFRPLANKDISINFALYLFFILCFASLCLGFFITPTFFALTILYLILQILYSMVFKHIAVIDILSIAAGYILRIYAGEFATGSHMSVWLILTTIAISLFLAVGKRRCELTLVSQFNASQLNAMRKSLSHYSERLLDVYASTFVTATFVFYSLFTFLESPQNTPIGNNLLLATFLPDLFHRKWLMITIIPVVYGLMRYLQDIYEKHEGESPENVFLSDKPLLITVIIWAFLVIGIIYIVNP